MSIRNSISSTPPEPSTYRAQSVSFPPSRALNRFAAAQGIPVVSTVDAHFEDDPEFRIWPRHCVAGTLGQRKAESTLLDKRVTVPNRKCELAIEGAQQIVIEKQTVDVFAAPNLALVLDSLAADRYVVYGVVTEICVLYAARGLLKSGRPVTVVVDAIEALKAEDSDRALSEIRQLGGASARLSDIVG